MRCTLTYFALALACFASQAGTVSVRFIEPDKYVDAGHGRVLENTQVVLREHFKHLAATLPATQSLDIQVLDIDLAGDVRPWQRVWPEVRVMRGTVDWPRMTLHYTLRDGERIVVQGEDSLSDMNYLHGSRAQPGRLSEPLPYEKRMLTSWFNERLLGQR